MSGGAEPQPGMSSAPPGVARRLHQTPLRAPARADKPPGAFRANLLNPAGPGLLGPGRAGAYASGGLGRGLLPQPLRARTRGLLTCASGRPARPQTASTPSGPARRGPTRPRPRSPRVGEEERRLRNRQPPPVPPPRPPAFPSSSGPRAAAAAVTNKNRCSESDALAPRDGQRQQPITGRAAARGGRAEERAWWAWRHRRRLEARSEVSPSGCRWWRAAALSRGSDPWREKFYQSYESLTCLREKTFPQVDF